MRTAATLAILAAVLSPLPAAAASSESTAVAQAIQLIERGRGAEADQIAASLRDPAARKTIEWMRLRRDTSGVGFERFAAFARENPGWPSVGLIRKRAEGALWEDKASARTIFAYFGQSRPTSGKGKLALARAHLESGNQAAAQALVHEAWREEPFSKDGEDDILRVFGPLLGRADHKARTDMFLYAENGSDALRNAARVGSDMVAVAKARIAAAKKDKALPKLLDAVPASARNEPSYIYARSQLHRREDKPKLAAEWVFKAPSDPKALVDTDQWWIERRMLARMLVEANDPRAAYRMAAGAAMPEKENYKVERDFLAGWVALRFLNDPATARRHFAQDPAAHRQPDQRSARPLLARPGRRGDGRPGRRPRRL